MPSITEPAHIRAVKTMLGNVANQVQSLAGQINDGISGVVLETLGNQSGTAWNTLWVRIGQLPVYPAAPSPAGWQSWGIGIDVLDLEGRVCMRFGGVQVALNGEVNAPIAAALLDVSGNVRVTWDDVNGPQVFSRTAGDLGTFALTTTSWW